MTRAKAMLMNKYTEEIAAISMEEMTVRKI